MNNEQSDVSDGDSIYNVLTTLVKELEAMAADPSTQPVTAVALYKVATAVARTRNKMPKE